MGLCAQWYIIVCLLHVDMSLHETRGKPDDVNKTRGQRSFGKPCKHCVCETGNLCPTEESHGQIWGCDLAASGHVHRLLDNPGARWNEAVEK